MSRITRSAWTDAERITLLVEILKGAPVDEVSLLARAVQQNVLELRWEDVPLPEGRSLNSCKAEYGDILRRLNPQSVSAIHGSLYPSLHSAPPTSSKRSFQESEGAYPTQLPSIQPRPPYSSASPVIQATSIGLAPPRSSPLGTLQPTKKKQGRPSKAEIAQREAEYAAQGKVYVPPARRRPKKPQALAGSPLPPPVTVPAVPTSAAVQTPPRQTADAPQSGSSGRRKRQRVDEQPSRQEYTRSAEPETHEEPNSSASVPVARSPSDRLRPDAKFAARSTANPLAVSTPDSTFEGDGSEIRDSEVKDRDPSSRTMHASF